MDKATIKRTVIKTIMLIGLPLTFLSATWLYWLRKAGIGKLEDRILMRIGMLPIIDHYYQPLVNPAKYLHKSLRDDRYLPGIDMNVEGQLELLSRLNYREELLQIPIEKKADSLEYYYNYEPFQSGDAEFLYQLVRYFKPARIFEVGSGGSTLLTARAIRMNKEKSIGYSCRHVCIEPYEQAWLEDLGVEVIRKRVELLDVSLFRELQAGDILFIDSSHIIRTQGDVLFEYLEVLPSLNVGVLIHVHDVFTPRDYPAEWVYTHGLWNEQYLMEALLSGSSAFKVIAALNFLAHNHLEELSERCPIFAIQRNHEPGSFWLMKT